MRTELELANRKISQLNAMLDYARKNQDEQQGRLRAMEEKAAKYDLTFVDLANCLYSPIYNSRSLKLRYRVHPSTIGKRFLLIVAKRIHYWRQ